MNLPLAINPYTPGAGMLPKYLAGREQLMQDALEVLGYIVNGYATRSIVYYGLRGVGKTVLLSSIEKAASDNNVFYEHIEALENSSFSATISLYILKLLAKMSFTEAAKLYIEKAKSVAAAFQVCYNQDGEASIGINKDALKMRGIADTGNLQNDLTELFVHLGQVGEKINSGAVLFIDEIQYLKPLEFEALMAALHRCNQLALPVVVIAAGLPNIAKIAGDIKSYAERLFQFVRVDKLQPKDAALALSKPAERFQVSYDDEALSFILEETDCYPYFIQEFGQKIWRFKKNGIIDLAAAHTALPSYIDSLDDSFYKVRHDRASDKDLEFMQAMIACPHLPCSIKDVAKHMHCSTTQASPVRAKLIHKGLIYATSRGEIDFTVPKFDQYLKRLYR
ncbi:MAG: AAA family ATPase [Phascolarctobacterium sp.]|nr:AAA family ATPase [Phascolarctobacterium sp.]